MDPTADLTLPQGYQSYAAPPQTPALATPASINSAIAPAYYASGGLPSANATANSVAPTAAPQNVTPPTERSLTALPQAHATMLPTHADKVHFLNASYKKALNNLQRKYSGRMTPEQMATAHFNGIGSTSIEPGAGLSPSSHSVGGRVQPQYGMQIRPKNLTASLSTDILS